MRNIIKVVIVVYLLVFSKASQIRENSNVLIPNNDVNIHAKIKEILTNNDADLKAFSDYEMENSNNFNPSKVEKWILHKSVPGFKRPENDRDDHKHEVEKKKDYNNQHSNVVREDTNINPKTTTERNDHSTAISMIVDAIETLLPMKNETLSTDFYETTTETNRNFNTSTQTHESNLTITTASNFNTTTSRLNETTLNQWNLTTSSYFISTQDSNNSTATATHSTTFFTTASAIIATTEPTSSVKKEECMFGKDSETIKWVYENGTLQEDFILNDDEMKNLIIADLSNKALMDFQSLENLDVLSLAYNSFDQLPIVFLNQSYSTLQFLSLAGNNFKKLDDTNSTLMLPNLRQLDLRNCKLKSIWRNFLNRLLNLENIYLSNNNIVNLYDDSFDIPSLLYLDLSFNVEDVFSSDPQSPLKMTPNVFKNLITLQFLDLSHTKIEPKGISALSRLPENLIGISVCYTELSSGAENFLSNFNRIKYLDISGNTQLNFTNVMFNEISKTLERLDARDANIRTLEWTKPLINLRILNLKDNKIRVLDNNSFSHMLYLEDLNLERNSIGNWYARLFTQNQELMTLNLRENTLTLITEDMAEDFLSVRHLAIGKNEFECSCDLHNFMHMLFEETKNANVSHLRDSFNSDLTTRAYSSSSTTHQPILLGVRNNLRPEYDIISRTYQKYYDEILKSIEALKKNNYRKKSKSFLSLSDLIPFPLSSSREFRTILLDYDVNNADYQCMNVTEKQRQSMLDLIELCDNRLTKDPAYLDISNDIALALITFIPTVLVISLLLFVIYWKWCYIRYFCILCKNSAILSFMDDDGGKEAIVRKSTGSVDIFLYDVFVSYSDQNRNWVLDEFIPNIEKRESINVCLHERDFTVGYGILENIVSCMDRSRCLLLLVSEKFLESQWCQFEMNLAQHRLLETRREKLIVVLLEEIPLKKQPKTLKYLMRTKTYIKWPQNCANDEKQIFWKRLKKSIISSKWENENYGSNA